MSNLAKSLRRYLAAAGIILAATAVAELLYRLTDTTRLSMVFLGGVLVAAYSLGSGPAYFAAGLAFLIYDFYLAEPRFTIQFGPEDLLALAMFLAVAMLTGSLTGRIRDEAKRAEGRARTTAALFDATRAFSASSDEAFIRRQLVQHLASAAKGETFVLDQTRMLTEPTDFPVPAGLLRQAEALEVQGMDGRLATTLADGWSLRPLLADGAHLGVAAWRTTAPRSKGSDERLLEILADVGAAAIARARLSAAKTEAETRARTEDLRNALLSSVSHDLRTPLAAIMASASSLSAFGESFDAATRKDLSTTIQQETERLDAFVANLLSMTRLESGALTVQQVGFSVPEVIERTVRRRVSNSARKVTLTIAPDLPEALGDPVLFEQAFGNVFENALRYTSEDQAITVIAGSEGARMSVEVQDQGPGIPAEDLQKIFEKFFRSNATAHKPGTGLGLSITRGLIEGMGGRVLARLNSCAGPGLTIVLQLPVAR